MKNCFKCNSQLDENAIICSNCAALQPEPTPFNQISQENAPQQSDNNQRINLSKQNPQNIPPQLYNYMGNPQNQYNSYYPQGFILPYQAYYQNLKTPNTTGFLIWSIILCLICQFLGIPAIIFSAIAIGAQNPVEKHKNLKIAKIFCIIGTVLSALIIIFYITYIILIAVGFVSIASLNTSSVS
jgi:hypothetical protein